MPRSGHSPVQLDSAIVKNVDSSLSWRGQRDTERSRFWRMLAFSIAVHAPLTPAAALLGLLGLLAQTPTADAGPPAPPITAIPVDLLTGDGFGPVGQEKENGETAASAQEGADKASAEKDPFDELDEEDDAALSIPDGPDKKPGDEGDAEDAEDKPPKAGTSVGDPVAMAGSAAKVADANANVRLLIFNDRIRAHPLGKRIGTLLGAAEQWKDFFGPGGLDPVTDVDRVLIAGPQLKDSSQVVAVLKVSADPARVRAAVDALVARDQSGGWMDAGVPAARAKADRAERVFVLPKPGIVVVTPPSAAAHAIKVGKSLKFPNPKGKEALTAYVVTPWRAFVGLPFEVPKSIKWVRMKIVATSDGGAYAELVAEDESEATAAQSAKLLTDRLNTVTRIDLTKKGGVFGKAARFLLGDEVKLVEPVAFSAKGKEIHGKVVATPKQLGSLLEAISGYAEQLADDAKKKAAAAAADAGAVSDAGEAGVTNPTVRTRDAAVD
jgi:hypothetical protein